MAGHSSKSCVKDKNLSLLRESFDGLAAWEDYLLSRSDGYIVDYSYYGDWAAPYYACEGGEIDAAKNAETEGILMSTGYSFLNCRLLSEMAAAEKAAAEKAAAENAAAKKAAAEKRGKIIWKLSEREKEIIKTLGAT